MSCFIEESSEESGCYDELNELLSDRARIADDSSSITNNGAGSNHSSTRTKRENPSINSENQPPLLNPEPDAGKQSLRQRRAAAKQEGSVFKSANWLSDSELIFSLNNQVGGLVRALRIFQELDIGIKHVESRKSKRRDSEFEIFVDIDCSDQEKMAKLVHHLR